MSYSENEIILVRVPFSSDNKNIIDFNNKQSQYDYFLSLPHVKLTNVNYVLKNDTVVVDVKYSIGKKYNYLIYKLPDIDNEYIFNFIISSSYNSGIDTTTYKIKVDTWQTYQFDITYYDNFIERAHVPKSTDTIGNWLEPEPLDLTPSVVKNIDTLNGLDWSPTWVLHATSKYENKEYIYKGTGSGSTLCSEYGYVVNTPNDIQNILNNYGRMTSSDILSDAGTSTKTIFENISKWFENIRSSDNYTQEYQKIQSAISVANLQDHRDELIGLYAVPKWCTTGSISNDIIYKTDNVSLDQNTLASGYVPKNKKLLSSVCKSYVLWNKNGFQRPLKPELCSGSTLNLKVGCCPMGTNGYSVEISNYKNILDSNFFINYSCQNRIGYDVNTGLDKSINILNSTLSLTADIGKTISNVSYIGDTAKSGLNLIDSLGNSGKSSGSSGEITSISDGRATLKLADVSPSASLCEYADKYLTAFGYSINEFLPMKAYMTSRNKFNYIKTRNCNISCKCSNEEEEEIKQMFNNGVTIWHEGSKYGDYDQTNN